MNAEKLVEQVRKEGASIRIVDGKVRLSADKPLPDALMVQLREVKDDIYQHLICRHTEPITHTVPSEWKEGVERVAGMGCPNNWPELKWPETQQSITAFLDKWGQPQRPWAGALWTCSAHTGMRPITGSHLPGWRYPAVPMKWQSCCTTAPP